MNSLIKILAFLLFLIAGFCVFEMYQYYYAQKTITFNDEKFDIPSHQLWTEAQQQYVDKEGHVNYQDWQKK